MIICPMTYIRLAVSTIAIQIQIFVKGVVLLIPLLSTEVATINQKFEFLVTV